MNIRERYPRFIRHQISFSEIASSLVGLLEGYFHRQEDIENHKVWEKIELNWIEVDGSAGMVDRFDPYFVLRASRTPLVIFIVRFIDRPWTSLPYEYSRIAYTELYI